MSIELIPLNRFYRFDRWSNPTGAEIRQVLAVSRLSVPDAAALLGLADSSHLQDWLNDSSQIPYSAWAMLCANAGLGSIWTRGPGVELTLEDLCRRPEKKERRVYENFKTTVTVDREPVVIEVNLALLSHALDGDSVWASNTTARSSATFRMDKYMRAYQEFTSGKRVYMPYLSFSAGRTRITDGRHRLYSLLDLGYTHCPVVADSTHVPAITTLVREEP
ncbi:hypothetical protein [Pandoraea sputorum]